MNDPMTNRHGIFFHYLNPFYPLILVFKMKPSFKIKYFALFAILAISFSGIRAQEIGGGLATSILLRKENAFSGHVSSNGFGAGYRQGKQNSVLRKTFFEVEMTTMRHAKEIRSINYFLYSSRSYYYGKMNHMLALRPGVGIHRIITEKPYWGGVEFRYFYFAGASLAVLKPVYLLVIKTGDEPNEYYFSEEKYNPVEHFADNIAGRAPFTKGLTELQFVPGAYIKSGLHFEIGKEETDIRSVEVGFILDLYPKHIPLVAFEKNKNFFLTLYLSYCFGKRYD